MAVNTEERHGQESLENHKHMFNQGVNYELYNFLGVHKISTDDESGYVFRVWAPHAKQVWVCGDFNNWDKSHPMTLDKKSGIWSIEVKESRENQYYKYLVSTTYTTEQALLNSVNKNAESQMETFVNIGSSLCVDEELVADIVNYLDEGKNANSDKEIKSVLQSAA